MSAFESTLNSISYRILSYSPSRCTHTASPYTRQWAVVWHIPPKASRFVDGSDTWFKPACQKASRSVHPFLHSSSMCITHRHIDDAACNMGSKELLLYIVCGRCGPLIIIIIWSTNSGSAVWFLLNFRSKQSQVFWLHTYTQSAHTNLTICMLRLCSVRWFLCSF